jgi:hypothetical protein
MNAVNMMVNTNVTWNQNEGLCSEMEMKWLCIGMTQCENRPVVLRVLQRDEEVGFIDCGGAKKE